MVVMRRAAPILDSTDSAKEFVGCFLSDSSFMARPYGAFVFCRVCSNSGNVAAVHVILWEYAVVNRVTLLPIRNEHDSSVLCIHI
jgi:hypothetical protein